MNIASLAVLWLMLAAIVLTLSATYLSWFGVVTVFLAWLGGVVTTLLNQRIRRDR